MQELIERFRESTQNRPDIVRSSELLSISFRHFPKNTDITSLPLSTSKPTSTETDTQLNLSSKLSALSKSIDHIPESDHKATGGILSNSSLHLQDLPESRHQRIREQKVRAVNGDNFKKYGMFQCWLDFLCFTRNYSFERSH